MNPRKIISLNLDIDKVNRLDNYVVRPCSRSDLVNEMIGYILNAPGMLDYFATKVNTELLASVNNE